MSDYLWDKTGEPEEEVARLENLLGALKHRPRPLDIPAAAVPQAATMRARPTPASLFSRPRLALAASLLLTLLAGTWLVIGERGPQAGHLARVERGRATGEVRQTETAASTDAAARTGELVDSAAGAKTPEPKMTAAAAGAAPKTHRPSRQPVAKRQKLTPRARDNAFAPREEVAASGAMRWQVERPLTPRQREATEQLMLALRLASAKFNYAQREMREFGRADK